MRCAMSDIRARGLPTGVAGAAAFVCFLSSVGSSDAHFVGLWFEGLTFEGEPGWSENIAVGDIFAQFTNPDDELYMVFGTTFTLPTLLTTQTGQGFLNSPFGGDGPPSQMLLDKHPELNWDTFVTIGPAVYANDQPGSDLVMFDPGWPGLQDDPIVIENGSWYVLLANTDVGRAGNYPDLRVRMARLVIDTDCNPGIIVGRVNIFYLNADNGGEATPVYDIGFGALQPPCPADLTYDYSVDILDLLVLLAAWGTDPVGPPDFDCDGTVGILDLLELLADWGWC